MRKLFGSCTNRYAMQEGGEVIGVDMIVKIGNARKLFAPKRVHWRKRKIEIGRQYIAVKRDSEHRFVIIVPSEGR